MMQCKNKRASTKETHGDHENMEVFWSIGLGVSQVDLADVENDQIHLKETRRLKKDWHDNLDYHEGLVFT